MMKMAEAPAIVAVIMKIFRQKGNPALNMAKRKILLSCKDDDTISQALRHFSKITLRNAMPVFPALISMSCEAIGGEAEKTTPFGAAIVMITGAADLHDDILDKSLSKGPKQTVLGKFGESVAVLAGDIMLVQGLTQLQTASESINKKQAKSIGGLVADAVFEICNAETLETQMKGRIDVTPLEFNEVIKLKAVVPELTMKIGAIIGNGNPQIVEALGKFGRTYGIVSIIVEEFSDLLNFEELKNRLKNECPPLPLIYALQNKQIKDVLAPLLDADSLSEESHKKIVETVLCSKEARELKKILEHSAAEELKKLQGLINGKTQEELEMLLLAPLRYLEFFI
jgi:geranylgeranyl pyrophosphate synthase